MKKWFQTKSQAEISAKEVYANLGEYDTDLNIRSKDDITITIYNPHKSDRNIEIVFDNLRATFYFSFQHAHFEYGYDDFEHLMDYIVGFISGKYVAVEFFKDGKNSFGGSRAYDDIDFSTVEAIASLFDNGCAKYYEQTLDQFKKYHYEVYAECWDSQKDRYADIVWDGKQFVIIRKTGH